MIRDERQRDALGAPRVVVRRLVLTWVLTGWTVIDSGG